MALDRPFRGMNLAAVLAVGMAISCSSSATPLAPSTMSGTSTGSPDGAPSPAPSPTPPPAASRVHYRITFDSTWSRETHPQEFPDDAHFSGLIGGTHAPSVIFWAEGALATEGIRNMAERGQKNPLQPEIEQAIATGLAGTVLSGGDIRRSPGSVTLDFHMTQEFPLVTLVAMVAPSPDWFCGVSGLALFENGAWKDDVRVDLYPYD